MNRCRRSLLTAILPLILLIFSTSAWTAPEYRDITILYTNDTHGHLLPFSYPAPYSDWMRSITPMIHTNIGGIARRATLIRKIEKETHGDALVMDAGDILDGSPFTAEYKGVADVKAMSAAGYDVATPGNHECYITLPELWTIVHSASYPYISANIVGKSSGKPLLPPYKIFDVTGVRIAVFGLTIGTESYKSSFGICKTGADVLDPINSARELVPQLRKQADIVVALTHLGMDSDPEMMRVATEVPGIDVVVDGHSHTRLAAPIFAKHADSLPTAGFGSTVIVQDGQWGGELGRLDLHLRRDGGPYLITSVSDKLITVTSKTPEDAATAAVVKKYYKPIAWKYDALLGRATADFVERANGENAVGSLVCDALRWYGKTQLGMYNVGGVRQDIAKGPIRMWDIACSFPFDNKIVTCSVSGKELKRILEECSPYVSGIRYKVEQKKLISATIAGKPISDSQAYTVTTADYSAISAFGITSPMRRIGVNYRVAIAAFIKSKKVIAPANDGRRITDVE